jgi:hypothetical protein
LWTEAAVGRAFILLARVVARSPAAPSRPLDGTREHSSGSAAPAWQADTARHEARSGGARPCGGRGLSHRGERATPRRGPSTARGRPPVRSGRPARPGQAGAALAAKASARPPGLRARPLDGARAQPPAGVRPARASPAAGAPVTG